MTSDRQQSDTTLISVGLASDSVDPQESLAFHAESPVDSLLALREAPGQHPCEIVMPAGLLESNERARFLEAARCIRADVQLRVLENESIAFENGKAPAAATADLAPVPDVRTLEDILTGGDPTECLLEAARVRTQDDTLRFSSENEPSDDTTPSAARAPVERLGHRFGWLIGDATDQATLTHEASILAPWLALVEQQRQLRLAAFTDSLTGAWSRRYLDRFLPAALARARAMRVTVTVMLFDIDDFKSYNDRYGHAAGDEILRESVRLLQSVIRPTDRVCRLGGDEFVVVFDSPEGPRSPASQPPAEIGQIARRFQQQICEHRFPKLGAEAPQTLTISAGMATFPWDGHDASSLIARADELSLQAKSQGKNAITFGPSAGAEGECDEQGAIDPWH